MDARSWCVGRATGVDCVGVATARSRAVTFLGGKALWGVAAATSAPSAESSPRLAAWIRTPIGSLLASAGLGPAAAVLARATLQTSVAISPVKVIGNLRMLCKTNRHHRGQAREMRLRGV